MFFSLGGCPTTREQGQLDVACSVLDIPYDIIYYITFINARYSSKLYSTVQYRIQRLYVLFQHPAPKPCNSVTSVNSTTPSPLQTQCL